MSLHARFCVCLECNTRPWFFAWLPFRVRLWFVRRRQRWLRPFCPCSACHGVGCNGPLIDRSDQAALDTACREGRLEWAYAEVRLEDRRGEGMKKAPDVRSGAHVNAWWRLTFSPRGDDCTS